MTEPRREPPREHRREPSRDLVSFGPEVTDTRRFTIGLWATEIVLFALLLAGFTVVRGVSVGLTVLVACAAMVWLAAVTAIVLRGRLQPLPGFGLRVAGIVAVTALAAWLAVFLSLSLGGSLTITEQVLFDVVGLLLQTAALASAYRARMFRWRVDLFRG